MRPDDRHLSEEVHQRASAWQLQIEGQGHERLSFSGATGPPGSSIEHYDVNQVMDQRLPYEEIERCCSHRKVDTDVDSVLRMVIRALFEGESKTLVATAEVKHGESLEKHKSGLELCLLFRCNFDRASTFNVMSILKSIRNIKAAQDFPDATSRIHVFERRHQNILQTSYWAPYGARVRASEDAWHQCLASVAQECRLGDRAS